MTFAEELDSGARMLKLDLAPTQKSTLLQFLELLQKWNKVFNLTAIREEEKLVPYHLMDSLAVFPFIEGKGLLDVGSGGGLPGIPLAILRPELRVVLLDSNHKKASFLRQASVELNLKNVEVVTVRAESYQPEISFSTAISRAFSDLRTFCEVTRNVILPKGALIAMKGIYPNEELTQLPSDIEVASVARLTVPGLNAERHLVIMRHRDSAQ